MPLKGNDQEGTQVQGMLSDRGTPEGSPGDSLSLKLNRMMGGGIAMSSGVVVGAVGVGVVVDVGIGAGIGADEGIDSTTPSSWTVWHGGDVALGGLLMEIKFKTKWRPILKDKRRKRLKY